MKRLTTYLLISILLTASVLTSACGNSTTLARVGVIFVQGAAAYKAELTSLHVGGLLSDAKFAKLDAQAGALGVTAQALADYLNTLPGVTSNNKAQILFKLAEAAGLVRGIVQNPDLIGAGADSLAVKVLQVAVITLQNASIAVSAVNVPPVGASSGGSTKALGKGVVVKEAVRVSIPKPPKGAEKYFQ